MKLFQIVVTVVAATTIHTRCYAGCNCDDWMNRGGYCVDYVKSRIPAFPIPKTDAEIAVLKNKETAKVEEGDVAIFDLGDYWHVAYVEKVHLDPQGTATAIDVSEMNFGGQISYQEYRNRWNPKNEGEWRRALCCGVTKQYDQMRMRKNIALHSVEQIWSPDFAGSRENFSSHSRTIMEKVREAVNTFIQFTEREL
jgi:hypothetical protein